ncbi:XTP/dITP diphosphohydrolase [Paucidesulfovibrio gracilis DSM 16080]|uniref:dITP/XTP pyrophosphatase n=1 Tax=Paucidesulfovibrio gracilis DSM 16080 TaxID=1121449 RepID=A0A1T4W674_9BACT|nr:XTP/dITP diphosphatase [Paucidesulfovibrio gracilis]SKA72558.1 XTP/dITP diphosphohydrolase [Paucidesulfovibrio gracilis DSM 16080]
MRAVVLATRNQGKIREFSALLHNLGMEVKGLDQFPEIGDIPETGATFLENARIKAEAVAKATGLIAVADDSGLAVDALDGAPGVHSARYAGEHGDADANNAKLLDALDNLPDEQRTARFVCCMYACTPDGTAIHAQESWEGRIAHGYSGQSGFGYDPIFFDPELGRTAAEMAPDEKNARSHRGKALAKLLQQWPGFLAQVAE